MTATLPPHADVRECRLYRFYVRHPLTGQRVLGYVGETVRQPLVRLLEHLYDQPWADTIIGWEVDDRVFAGKAQVLAAEELAIRSELPLYNVIHNEGEHRIPPPAAIRQRKGRDAVKPPWERWVHPDDRPGGQPRTVSDSRGRARATAVRKRSWRPWQKHLLAATIVALVLTLAAWMVLHHYGRLHGDRWWQTLAGCAGFTVWCWLGCPWFDKRSGRRWRRAVKRLRGRR